MEELYGKAYLRVQSGELQLMDFAQPVYIFFEPAYISRRWVFSCRESESIYEVPEETLTNESIVESLQSNKRYL